MAKKKSGLQRIGKGVGIIRERSGVIDLEARHLLAGLPGRIVAGRVAIGRIKP
jgi:hypothetical protein